MLWKKISSGNMKHQSTNDKLKARKKATFCNYWKIFLNKQVLESNILRQALQSIIIMHHLLLTNQAFDINTFLLIRPKCKFIIFAANSYQWKT